jgi:hypothetical protein
MRGRTAVQLSQSESYLSKFKCFESAAEVSTLLKGSKANLSEDGLLSSYKSKIFKPSSSNMRTEPNCMEFAL